jgi:hypothetical protein
VTHHKPNLRYVTAALATAVCLVFALVAVAQAATPVAAFTRTGAAHFNSAPSLVPPKLKKVKKGNGKLAPGYFLIANFKNFGIMHTNGTPVPMVGQSGPIMYDKHLSPVWVHGVATNRFANNFREQSYNGKPALSWWEGTLTNTGQPTSGEDFVVNQSYKIVAKLKGADGWTLSFHEFEVTGGHLAWVTAYKEVPRDLSSFGGAKNGKVLDVAVQEYDLNGGKLLYSWDALDHIQLSESKLPAPSNASTPWDAYHINDVQPLPNGQFLTSFRNEWAAYLVDETSNNIVWSLGGKHSTFNFGNGASFSWQHDVEWSQKNGTVSLFDNACCGLTSAGKSIPPTSPSRGLVLKLDTTAHTATLVSQYLLGSKLYAGTQGNTQLLPNGNALVGFGTQPYFAEFTKTGSLLLQAQLPSPDVTYRAFVGRWTGKPTNNPGGAVKTNGSKTTVYASWNGATNVYSWRVFAGSDSKHLKPVASKRHTGFETSIPLKTSYGAYQVVALGNKKQTLKRSKVFGASKSKGKSPSSPSKGGGGTTGGGGGFY